VGGGPGREPLPIVRGEKEKKNSKTERGTFSRKGREEATDGPLLGTTVGGKTDTGPLQHRQKKKKPGWRGDGTKQEKLEQKSPQERGWAFVHGATNEEVEKTTGPKKHGDLNDLATRRKGRRGPP